MSRFAVIALGVVALGTVVVADWPASGAEPVVHAVDSDAGALRPVEAAADVPGGIRPVPAATGLDARKVALGEMLFHDGRLSGDGRIACSSCHDLGAGGADGRAVPIGVGDERGELNAPTVLNASLNFRLNWDGRSASLADHLDDPIHDPARMGTDWETVLHSLAADRAYRRRFDAIYPDGVTAHNVRDAIVEFERSLVTPGARFDRFLGGDGTALTPEERRGWDLFVEIGCVRCHQGVNLGGSMYQKLGIVEPYFAGREPRTADLGRYNITGRSGDEHVFKVPTLRNVTLTAPYLHDGSVDTLEDAVRTMARHELGADLLAEEVAAIAAFLRTLTGRQPTLGR